MTQTIDLGKLRFNYSGAYVNSTQYSLNDVVSYGGNVYCYTNANATAGNLPTDAAYWTVMTVGAGSATYSENVYYVTPHGHDVAGGGTSITDSFATIAYAVTQVPAFSTIYVKTGSYAEQLPIVVPPNVAIVGDGQRETIVSPKSGLSKDGVTANAAATMFLLSNGSILNKMSFTGLTGWVPGSTVGDITTSGPKAIFCALNPASPVTTKSPYVLECAAFGSGAIGAYVDGSVHSTGNKSMLFHEYTNIQDNGVGLWIDNGARAEAVSCFTYYCYFGYAGTNGGQLRSVAGNNSYGTYGAVSSGYSASETPVTGSLYGSMITLSSAYSGTINVGDTITSSSGATATVTNAQTTAIYVADITGTFAANNTFTTTSGGTGTISSIGGQSGFVLVLNGLSALPQAGASIQIAGDSSSYIVQSVSGGWSSTSSVITVVLAQQKATASAASSAVTIRYNVSLVRLTGHDFLNIGTGGVGSTNYPGTPTQAPDQSKQVVQTYPGRVYYVVTDQAGNFNVGPYFAVNQATGAATLNASAFNLSGLTSLRLGSIGAQLGAQINEFSTDGTMAQNSPVKCPTQSAVVSYVTDKLLPLDSIIADGSSLYTNPASTFADVPLRGLFLSGGGSISWALSGTYPSNLTLSSSGVLSTGSTSVTAGSYSFTVTAITGSVTASKNFTLVSNTAVPYFSNKVFSSMVSPSAAFSSSAATATVGSGSITYAITSGSLPSWATLNTSTGVVTGTAPPQSTTFVTYSFTVTATNGTYSTKKTFTWKHNYVLVQGQQLYGTNNGTGTFSWTCPSNVTAVSVVAVGGGGAGIDSWAGACGSGGGLGWKNDIPVVPGQSYTVVVGGGGTSTSTNAATSLLGGNSYFISTTTVCGYGGGNASGVSSGGPNSNNTYGGGWYGDGGGAGGYASSYQGGGGAGGYSARGGNGYEYNASRGGGGGNGGGFYSSTYGTGAGGGVGLNGEGTTGTRFYTPSGGYTVTVSHGGGGEGGSGGQDGGYGENPWGQGSSSNIQGGNYGGGGGGSGTSWTSAAGNGGQGGVRIIWGPGRAFPSTNTADQTTYTL